MSRYLTPSKIGLLALVSLYTESVIPVAASISVLSFIASHLLPARSTSLSNAFAAADSTVATPISAFQKTLIVHDSGIPGRTVWDLFLKKLWGINSLDALHAFFDLLPNLFQSHSYNATVESNGLRDADRVLLSRTSPLGAFVRRAHLEFTRLQFNDSTTLWKNFVLYRESTFTIWRKRNPAAGNTSFDINLVESQLTRTHLTTKVVYGSLSDEDHGHIRFSLDDIERLIEFQIDQTQKMGTRVADRTKVQLEEMIKTGIGNPGLSHYLNFLDAWKAGDYPSSFDSLHRYFDYTLHSRDKTFYQYALLNLALLQADFGCYTEAITAMQETIATARENKDDPCLNYSLSWLYQFGKGHPDEIGQIRKGGVLGTENETLAFLKTRAKSKDMWTLMSACFLSESRLRVTNGESFSLAFENITKASHLNMTRSFLKASGPQFSMQAFLLSRLGVSYLSWLYNEVFVECYAEYSSVEDALTSLCTKACALAQKGKTKEALAILEKCSQGSLRTLKNYQYWVAYKGLFRVQMATYNDDLSEAEHFLTELEANPPPNGMFAFATAIQRINVYMRRQDYSEAMRLTTDWSAKLEVDADISQQVKLMILKACAYEKSGLPQKGFSTALRAVSVAYKARLLDSLWEAIVCLSKILISVHEFEAAVKLLESITPQVLEYEDCILSADTFCCLADAHVGMAVQAKQEPLKQKEKMTKALEYVERAFDEFSRIEDVNGQCAMLGKKAAILHGNGDALLANDCAAKYVGIERNGAGVQEISSHEQDRHHI